MSTANKNTTTSGTLVISFKLAYDGKLLASDETSPHIMAWSSLPGRKKSFAPVIWASKSKKHSRPVVIKLKLPLGANYDKRENTYRMPLDTTIGIQARCCTPNEEGRITIRGCGEALFPLGLELNKVKN